MSKGYYTVQEAAEKSGVSTQTIREKLLSKEINGTKAGREWRVDIKFLNKWASISSDEDDYKKDLYIKELEKENEILKMKLISAKNFLSTLNETINL